MRSLLLVCLVLLFAACDTRTREEREFDRAQHELDRAREELAEAREQLNDELDEIREDVDESLDDIQEDIDEDLDDSGIAEAIGNLLEKVGQALNSDPDVEPIEFRKLRDLLPDEIDGMEREHAEGESVGALGIRMSTASARYDGLGRDMEVKLVDLGTMHRAAEEGIDALDAHMDREWEDGYERTTEVRGHPAHIRVDHHGSRTDLEATILISGRFVVHIEADGRDVSEDLIDEVMDSVERLERAE